MQRQSSLGTPNVHKAPSYQTTKIGRVINIANYTKYGMIDVAFLDYGATTNVWVVGEVDRMPMEGDMVIVGYLEGRKDSPFMLGFVRNKSFTSNSIAIGKDYIRLQMPADDKDREGAMLDFDKKVKRPYVEITPTKTTINRPTGSVEINAPTVKIIGTAGTNSVIELNAKTVKLVGTTITAQGGNVALTGSAITANGEDLTVDKI